MQGATNLRLFASAAKPSARKGEEEDQAEHDSVDRERGETMPAHPVEKPGDDRVSGEKSGHKADREAEPVPMSITKKNHHKIRVMNRQSVTIHQKNCFQNLQDKWERIWILRSQKNF